MVVIAGAKPVCLRAVPRIAAKPGMAGANGTRGKPIRDLRFAHALRCWPGQPGMACCLTGGTAGGWHGLFVSRRFSQKDAAFYRLAPSCSSWAAAVSTIFFSAGLASSARGCSGQRT